MLFLVIFLSMLVLPSCTHTALRRYGDLIEPQIGRANKADMARQLGSPENCKSDGNYENCEFRTSRGKNAQVPAVHQRAPGMGPDLSPYEHFDVISLQFDSLGVLRGWKPERVD